MNSYNKAHKVSNETQTQTYQFQKRVKNSHECYHIKSLKSHAHRSLPGILCETPSYGEINFKQRKVRR